MACRRTCGLALLLPAFSTALGRGPAQRMDAVLEHLLLESQQLAVQDLPKQGLDEMDNVVLRLEECLAKLQDIQRHLVSQVASHGAFANVTKVDIPQPINDMASRVSREIQPFIVVGLVCVTVALLKGRRPLDLFSVDIYSPWEAALAFTLSSFTGLVLVNQWVLSFLPDNPFTLYFSELAMCFLAVTTCAPLLMGASKFSTRWQASASLVAVICFGALCLADEISRVVFFFVVKESRSSSENYSLVLVPCLVVVTLYVGLLLTSLLKVLYRWGLAWRCVEPYGVGLLRNCKTYVAARLAGRASAGELPVPLPAAVLVQVAGVGSFMAMLVLQMGYLGYVRYHELRLLAVALLRPIEPLFKFAGAPLPTDALDFALPRIIISYYLALGCGACYEIWLMFTVLRGYRRMFADLAMGRRYHGQELVKSAGPGIFHAQWATYCCGALIGNAAMALVLLMFILWLLFLVLSLPQFWQMMWGFRKWWIVYEKYVMDADKLLNNLPTDFASDGIPACRNDYMVKSTAKMVYDVERCAQTAMMRAEHVNKDEEAEVNQILNDLHSSRIRVLVPVNGYSSPASFPGHPQMSSKDWETFERTDSAGQLANQWGTGSHGAAGHGTGGHGAAGHGGFGHGAHGQGAHGDVYGQPPRPQEPLQHGRLGPPEVYQVPVELEEKRIRAVVEKAKQLNKDPSLIPGPVAPPDGGRPAPPIAKMPIFGAQQPMLDNGVPSTVGLPVFGKPVMIQMLPPLAFAMELVAHSAAFNRGRSRVTRTIDFL